MKKNILLLSAVAILAGLSLSSCNENTPKQPVAPIANDTTAVAGSIVFFSLDRVMAEYDMANDLRAVVETKVNSIQAEITRRENKLTRELNDFNNKLEKGLLTNSVAQAQQQKLQQQQQSYQKYVVEKQQEMAEEQQVMLNNIMNAINEYIVKYNEEKQFAMILTTSGDLLSAPVVIGNPSLDITEEILKGLNDEYVKSKDKAPAAEE
ncbi:MAG: OmpH family outer membrane protein [Bacteroidales bacterium]|nr:OmpH family outer membrane protein [Bacteroidales bacterium]